ncbi:phosphatase PAP2 family protein [Paenibacillus turpanensis]|uniref:phosphatase PAP2 family protein n=1 Tax=Paenibacillus turpanensis TaxID=2689078 RepID=UPI00140CDE4D|nr:phosphatase PAP2 family protein [Paenibacillus turpanensis]
MYLSKRLALWLGLGLGIKAAAGMILFAYTDLIVSRALYDPTSLWAHGLEVFGEHPAWLLFFIGSSLLVQGAASMLIRFAAAIGTLGSSTILIALTVIRAYDLSSSMSILVTSFAGGVVLSALTYMLLSSVPKQKLTPLIPLISYGLTLIFFEMILVFVLKTFWGRVRFRDLLPDVTNFTLWFIPDFFSGSRSFPSGHAANGWTLLILLWFIPLAQTPLRVIVWTVAIAFGFATALSRIVVGAHYASDVLAGSLITLTLFLVYTRLISKRQYEKH